MANATARKVVTVIPIIPLEVVKGLPLGAKKRVCAYCRVSTDNVAQESSFESQVNYYTNYINTKRNWTMVDIYADEGISGTSTEKRTDFKRMIEDCKAGKIDMVVTKSISRFATYVIDGKDACGAKAVDENVLMGGFVRMFNRIYEDRQSFIKTMTANIEIIILLKPDGKEAEALDLRIGELKNALKKLIRFQVNNNADSEVYNEEYKSISEELGEVRKKRLEHDKVIESKDGLKQRFDEILETINSRDSALL